MTTTPDRSPAPGGAPALPGVAHVPGSGTAPDRARLAALVDSVESVRAELVAGAVPAGFTRGCVLYEAGFFWEAHEVWEPVWRASAPNGRERRAAGAVIALANGCLKLVMDRPRAALRLLRTASVALRECGGGLVLGLDPQPLAADVQRLETRVAASRGQDVAALVASRPTLARTGRACG